MTGSTTFSAVLWDFGGVITSSPFEAFRRFEAERDIPLDTIRTINATDPDTNAWARFERNDISIEEFDETFAQEARRLGHRIRGYDVLELLRGDIRPDMVHALVTVKSSGYKTACLTNNMASSNMASGNMASSNISLGNATSSTRVMDIFDAVVESSVVGCRKPEPRFYEIACELLDVPPQKCIFLDDLGVNLKPAAALGMTTIKVVSSDQAIADLETLLGIPLQRR